MLGSGVEEVCFLSLLLAGIFAITVADVLISSRTDDQIVNRTKPTTLS